ncbi:hypothetical protein K402DRAFT_175885 [Aulographum hederae CBS 113979]|uniref:Uncharacterized protein n=1 Tax=Aulographum hederae CBS 113979 TaxID=1176131 RepID=A0A6G1GQR2_9PEZI|nr:hypothetical protein K402DRAFT_175885 [Aulographum hederae CBS 113979]
MSVRDDFWRGLRRDGAAHTFQPNLQSGYKDSEAQPDGECFFRWRRGFEFSRRLVSKLIWDLEKAKIVGRCPCWTLVLVVDPTLQGPIGSVAKKKLRSGKGEQDDLPNRFLNRSRVLGYLESGEWGVWLHWNPSKLAILQKFLKMPNSLLGTSRNRFFSLFLVLSPCRRQETYGGRDIPQCWKVVSLASCCSRTLSHGRSLVMVVMTSREGCSILQLRQEFAATNTSARMQQISIAPHATRTASMKHNSERGCSWGEESAARDFWRLP